MAAILLLTTAPNTFALEMDWLSLGAREPKNTIISLTGSDTSRADATARLEQADIVDHCENFQPWSMDECLASWADEIGTTYSASANCSTGTIKTVSGRSYTFAGYWESDIGEGRTRWRDGGGAIVSTSTAAGGLGISQQWEVLCPTSRLDVSVNSAPETTIGDVVGIDHNGSFMWFDEKNGLLYYEKPKDSLSGLVTSGTVLFRGSPWSFDDGAFETSGTAYTFRKGCEPAAYAVSGGFVPTKDPSQNDTIVLKGAAPIREKNGCQVTGYSNNSANAVLVFDLHYGDF